MRNTFFSPSPNVLWFIVLQEYEIEYTRISYLSDLEVDTEYFSHSSWFMVIAKIWNWLYEYKNITL